MVMRARTAAEAQALGELCGNIMALATAAYVMWSTVIAFAGGTIPLTHWHIGGGAGAGLLWMCVVDPLVVSIALVLAYVSVAVLTLVLRFNAGLRSPRETAEPLHSLP
jgi:hypothetical protein